MVSKPDSQQKRELYLEAIRIQDPDERQRFLDERCAGESQLRSDLAKLLNANAPQVANPLGNAVSSETNLSTPEAMGIYGESFEYADSIDISNHPMIGRYKLLEQIGHGGMGTVFMAQQSEPVQRKVALKVIKPGMDTREVIARFEAERQALALMDHPNIARVLDGGSTDEGRPYFVMELVRGVPITQFCEQKNMSLRERLELFVDVCKAVQHAHQKGIIHRDLKPSNIMITLRDGVPVVKVIDFGVAKALSQQLTEKTLYTHYSQVVGTPLYMAPEQAEMSCLDVDTRSDIYSLGVVLYELLTGTTPFDRETLSSLGIDGIRKLLQDQEPPRPSVRVSTLRQAHQSTIEDKRKLDTEDISNQLKRELDWIVMKALEKDRERRYETANAFAADVQRYLNDEPVRACPPTVSYRLRKYIRKHKAWLTTAALLILMLITSTAVSGVFAYQANEARIKSEKSESDAKDAQNEAETEKEKALAAQKQSDENFASALAAIDKLLEHASNPALGEIPKVQLIRRDILEDVIKFYRESKVAGNASITIQNREAQTRIELAVLERHIGNTDKAIEMLEQLCEDLESLVKQAEQPGKLIKTLAESYKRLGYIYNEVRDAERAIACFQKSIERLEYFYERTHGRGTLLEIITMRQNMANTYRLNGNRKRADQLTREAYTALPKITEAERPNYTHQWVTMNMGLVLAKSNPQEAEVCFRKAVEYSRRRNAFDAREFPSEVHAAALITAANALRHSHPEDALEYVLEAVEVRRVLAENFPSFPKHEGWLKRDVQLCVAMIAEQNVGANSEEILARFMSEFPSLSNYPPLHEKIAELVRKQEGASEQLTTLSKRHVEQPVYALELVRQLADEGHVNEAQAQLLQVTILDEELDFADEEFASFYLDRAGLYRDFGQFDNAIADASRSIELTQDGQRFDAVLFRARTHVANGDEHAAIEDFTQILEKERPDWKDIHQRGACYFRIGEYERALADIREAMNREPKDLSKLFDLPLSDVASCENEFYRQGYLDLVDEIVEMQDRSTESLITRAAIAAAFSNDEKASEDLQAVFDRGEGNYYTHYRGALLSLEIGETKRYRTLCQRMLDSTYASSDTKSSYETHFAAWTCALAPNAVADYKPATELARKAVEKDPSNQQYLDGLGAILLRAGQYREAKEQLNKARNAGESDNTSPSYIHYFLAMTEHHLHNPDAAKENLTQAIASANKELSGSPAWNRKLTLELLKKETEALILSPNSDANN